MSKIKWTLPAESCGTCDHCANLLSMVEHFSNTPTDRRQWAQIVEDNPCVNGMRQRLVNGRWVFVPEAE